jgi:hypothetical protein
MKNVAKECVLIEAFTGINCPFCPAAALAITQMINEDLPIAPLAFHTRYYTPSDYDYATSETDSRSSWYKVTGYPTVIIDGVESHAGGGPACPGRRSRRLRTTGACWSGLQLSLP